MKALLCDLNKTIINIGFVAAVLITTVLCFTTGIYMDYATGKSYSVFEAVFSFDKAFIQSHYNFASILIFQQALSGYIKLFLPIVVSFPFMVAFCAERNSGYMRFAITRMGKHRYYFFKFISALLGGGSAIALGVIFYGMIVAVIFPALSSYNVQPEILENMIPNGVLIAVMKTIAAVFLYGMITALPAFFISAFCKNPYLITCIPFMLLFIWDTVLKNIADNYIDDRTYEKLNDLIPFYPDSIPNLIRSNTFDKNSVITILLNLAYIALACFGFVIIMNRRVDKGA